MSTFNRRDFLKTGSMAVVAAGVVTALPVLPAVAGAAKPRVKAPTGAPEGPASPLTEPLVARVRDVNTGEIDLFVGEQHIVTRDRALAAALARAAR